MVARFWPPNCIEPRANYSLPQISLKYQVKNFGLLHAETWGPWATFYVCSEKRGNSRPFMPRCAVSQIGTNESLKLRWRQLSIQSKSRGKNSVEFERP